jgi:hypothetical protein
MRKEEEVDVCSLENGLQKKRGYIVFQKFTKDFPVNGNDFLFDHHFTMKQTP